MNNKNLILQNINIRNKVLPSQLSQLKIDLEFSFEKNILEAGVINPGYFSYFLPILENYRLSNIITKYHITEEQHTDGLTGKFIKIPVVDVFLPENSTSSIRIFIISESFLK